MKARLAALTLLLFSASVCQAGIRSEGPYSGTVVFDRWDSCTLYSGVYLMYIADDQKEALRPRSGESVLLDATRVLQPFNPGDGVISEFANVRPAVPDKNANWFSLEGVALNVAPAFEEGGPPVVAVTIENRGGVAQRIHSSELAPTLLTTAGREEHTNLMPGAGPSYALITRQAFIVGGDEPRTAGEGIAMGTPYAWRADQALPRDFVLHPGQSRTIRLEFDLPAGEYDFLAGYGGGVHAGRGLASNLVAFDVDEQGGARQVKIEGRQARGNE